jgi:molybdopterin molybdotransferase
MLGRSEVLEASDKLTLEASNPHPTQMLSLEEARERILAHVQEGPVEKVRLAQGLGRYLAEDLESGVDLPPFDNSAMDGYAVRAQDLARASESNRVSLTLVGKIPAGQSFEGELNQGGCIRIFTGSPLPKGADAVVMQEDTEPGNDATIIFHEPARPWEHVRLKGEDLKARAKFAQKGERLSPVLLGVAAATGLKSVSVRRRPVVGILATGSELQEAGKRLKPGQIFESNRVLIKGLVEQAGAEAKVYPILPDIAEELERGLLTAFGECDLVITSGGVSIGEFDLVQSSFKKLGGELEFWKISMRPGKPFLFGKQGGRLLFGLPGNPVSAAVTFSLLARSAILKMQGAKEVNLPGMVGVLAQPLVNRGERRHFVRVRICEDGSIHSAGTQASHMLSSLALANGLLDMAPDSRIEAGTRLKVLLWS